MSLPLGPPIDARPRHVADAAPGARTLKTGTTTVGITTSEGVVMAADQRATMGRLIAHKDVQKLFEVEDHLAMTVAGSVGDAQVLVRWLKAELDLYRLRRGTPATVKAASTLMANILNQRKFAPFYVQLLLGGVDSEGNHIYSLDAAGGSIPDKFVTTGSGSVFVYGVLEDRYKDDMSLADAVTLAIRGISAAMKRDSASGDGITLCTITPDEGYQQLPADEIQRRRKKLGVL